jgi:tetratricopeptide (TPR) repeat protein
MMSISDDLLSKLSKSYIATSGHQTFLDALRTLQSQNGQEWWFLVVDLGDGRYLAARFSDLRERVKSEGQAVLSAQLKDLGAPLVPVEAVEQSTACSVAEKRAESSPIKVVVVTWGDAVIGVLIAPDVGVSDETSSLALVESQLQDEGTDSGEVEGAREEDADAGSISDAASVKVSIDGSVESGGQVITAGRDVVISKHIARALEGGPEWLIRVVGWVQRNVILTALGFLAFVVFPTVWIVATGVLPLLNLTSEQMDGQWNVAVAGFTDVGDESIERSDVERISKAFYDGLNSDMVELGDSAEINIQVWGPDRAGTIRGDTPEDRADNAEKLAKNIRADMVIYGTVQSSGDSYQVQPEFYVNIENNYELREVSGQYAFGDELPIIGSSVDSGSSHLLGFKFSSRSKALALITWGLANYSIHQYEDALALFELASKEDYWKDSKEGREVIYHFQGNAAAGAFLLDRAEEAYQAALEIEPKYARAYAGLASNSYLRSLESVTDEAFEPDMELLDRALEYYEQALEDEMIQPPTADVPVKVAFGRGHVYMVQWLAGQDTLEQAIEEFEFVIEKYGDNPRLREYAAEAHARLGQIERQQLGNAEVVIQRYLTATELSTTPNRKGLFLAELADMYDLLGQAAEAEKANQDAITAYKNALRITYQDERKAEYWAAIATRHEHLGEIDEAIRDLEQATGLLLEDSETRAEYQSRLDALKAP